MLVVDIEFGVQVCCKVLGGNIELVFIFWFFVVNVWCDEVFF